MIRNVLNPPVAVSANTKGSGSTRKCINSAGARSRIQLAQTPRIDQEITLGAEAVAALHCWRARAGEIFTVCDPGQQEYRVRIITLNEDAVTLVPFAEIPATESPLRMTLLQALPEKERFELVLQKATEIGVARIVPYQSAKSSTQQERDSGQKKSHRWPNVVLKAARQCRRGEIPELSPVVDWQDALEECAEAEMSLLCYEGEGGWPLAEAINKFRGHSVAVMIGPEGGFSQEEIAQAQAKGVQPVNLGPRMLRTESAAILAAGIIQFAAGDLGR